ncbi:MAG: hypothetical protein IPP42_18500 [Saprospiraceae bacterium]|nr:hypothetical protein [Saprospiraceae bacterium]
MTTSAIGISFADVLSGPFPCNAVFTRTWVATDACKNFASCKQIIKVKDTIAPKIVCPKDITVQCTADIAPSITATATDNCTSTASIIINATELLIGTLPCNGTITRTWKATDICGNASTCKQIIK